MDTTTEPPRDTTPDPAAGARAAQERWAGRPIKERLRFVRDLRRLIAENAAGLAATAQAVSARPLPEKLVSEVLPLADGCRWLARRAARVLAPRRCGAWDRPFYLQGASFEVQRQPFGIVLVIGPANYPLFLPAVHSLHALVAGNAVLLKPAPGARRVALFFASLAYEAGLEPALLTVLDEGVQAARDAVAAGVDKVIFTGSSQNGRDLLATLAKTNTPCVMELSGLDAMLVLADADLNLVMRALRFAARLNGGQTCIAPRRIVAVGQVGSRLLARRAALDLPPLPLECVEDDATAVRSINGAEFALGASIFCRDLARARAIAARIKTGVVLINDLIVPTADPRMPFGGVKASGFGTTRGDEGLLEMTFPHVVAVRRGRMRPHFAEPIESDSNLFAACIRAAHGRVRLATIRDLLRAVSAGIKTRKQQS